MESQVESEDVVFTLETIVEKFGEEMAPYAVGLCQHLTQAFWRLQVGRQQQISRRWGAVHHPRLYVLADSPVPFCRPAPFTAPAQRRFLAASTCNVFVSKLLLRPQS